MATARRRDQWDHTLFLATALSVSGKPVDIAKANPYRRRAKLPPEAEERASEDGFRRLSAALDHIARTKKG